MQFLTSKRTVLGYDIARSTLLGLVSLTVAACAQMGGSSPTEPGAIPPGHAQISFVQYGGIDDWKAEDDSALLIRASNRQYYRATFMGPCPNLRFANRIGFVSDTMGRLDRFGSIIVQGRECYFRSLEAIPKPENW